MSKIYAIDFDGTLCKTMFPAIGDPIPTAIEYVKKLKADGHKLILWTCRVGENLEEAVKWCEEQGLEFDAVNENLKEIIDEYGVDSRKVTADFYIDDKNLSVGGEEMERNEQRTMQSFFNTDFEVRADEDKNKYLEGYFIKFNEETELSRGIFEEVKPEAVSKSLKDNDVRCLFNHDTGIVLGRTGNGTLKLTADDKGVFGRVTVNPNDKQAMDILARIERGDINACSFGFNINPGGEEMVTRDDGTVKFLLRDIDIKEVSAVTFPAYPTTVINARKEDVEAAKKRLFESRKAELMQKIRGVQDEATTTDDY